MRRVTPSDIPLDQADRLGSPVIQVYALDDKGRRYPSRLFRNTVARQWAWSLDGVNYWTRGKDRADV